MAGRQLPADNHLHTQFSYDAHSYGDMLGTCRRAVELGLPAVAFTEHVDFAVWGEDDAMSTAATERVGHRNLQAMDVDGYLAEVERCRAAFPGLRILTGMEAGEPHLFGGSLARLAAQLQPQRVLGSLHAVVYDGVLRYAHHGMEQLGPHEVMRRYLAEVLHMVQTCDAFEVLAHVDFPRRYWPDELRYAERDYEDELRAIFAELAGQGRVLELNTKSPLASVEMMRWWYEAGGPAVSFGSDSHNPWGAGDKFDLAVDIAEAAGFRPGRDRYDFWRR